MLNTKPPSTTSAAKTYPAPGRTMFARSCARLPLMPMTRHTLSWMAMSMTTLATIAAANDAP